MPTLVPKNAVIWKLQSQHSRPSRGLREIHTDPCSTGGSFELSDRAVSTDSLNRHPACKFNGLGGLPKTLSLRNRVSNILDVHSLPERWVRFHWSRNSARVRFTLLVVASDVSTPVQAGYSFVAILSKSGGRDQGRNCFDTQGDQTFELCSSCRCGIGQFSLRLRQHLATRFSVRIGEIHNSY